MRIIIASEFRCTVCNQKYYLASKAYYIYERYAKAFGDVTLISRFVNEEKVPDGYLHAGFISQCINIESLYGILLGKYDRKIEESLSDCNLVIVRIPSLIAYRVFDIARKKKIRILTESMGDAWDAYWNHGILGKVIAPYMHFKMKHCVKNADYAIYVTKEYLQRRYPTSAPTINASNVTIDKCEDGVLEHRLKKIEQMNPAELSLMTTADIDVVAKGQQYVFKAIPALKEKGINIKYYLAGFGNSERLVKLAKRLNIESSVIFLGGLTMQQVYESLDNIDIYIQPSLQEGLPRAVIEAMSRGCPCIGSNTAGTPELLQPECIFQRKSSKAIVDKILEMLGADLKTYARTNYEVSEEYSKEALEKRRNTFFSSIIDDCRDDASEKVMV